MKEAAHFDTEREFRDWFEKNLSLFGIRSIFLSQEVCPDYVVVMESGEYKKVEAELLAINFRYHNHSPEKADFIVAAYAKEETVDGVPVKALHKLWELRQGANEPPPEAPLSEDELRILEAVEFGGGIELSSLANGDFAGQDDEQHQDHSAELGASSQWAAFGCVRNQDKVAGMPSLNGVALMPKARVNLLLPMTNGFSNSYIISTTSRTGGVNNPTRLIIIRLYAPIFAG
jgi:hypothetical protein